MMEYAVKHGQQVFAISWRNPTERHADWDLDTYAGAVLEALEAVEEITGADKTHVMGLCAGGIVLSTVVAHLAAQGRAGPDRRPHARRHACSTSTTPARPGAFMGANTAMAATADSARKGYLERPLARGRVRVAAPERPDLELLGLQLPDGQDPAGVRHPVLERRRDQPAGGAAPRLPGPRARQLARPSRARRRCSARRSTCRRSRSTPTSWRGSPTTSRRGRTPTGRVNLLGSEPRFVLSTSGHIAALVNPPGNEKATLPGQRRAARGAGGVAREREQTPGTLVGRLDRRGSGERSGAKKTRPQDARRQGPQAARRRAGQLRARVAVPRVRVNGVAAALRAPRERRAAAADHRLHDQLGGVRARARPLRRALRVHHLRQPRLGPLGRAAAADLDGRAGRRRRRAAARARRRERARVRALDGRDDRPGARDPLPRARARAGARRDDARAARGRRGRRCASSARSARGAPAAGATRARVAGRVAVLRRVPARAPRAGARAAAPLRPPPRDAAGRLVALVGDRLPRHGLAAAAASRRRRSSCTASATRWRRSPTPGCSPSGSRTPSCASCPAPATRTCSSARRSPSSC